MSANGISRVQFVRRLGIYWHDLADFFEISDHVRRQWERGHEARQLWLWLEQHGRLDGLPSALAAIDRKDLIQPLPDPPPVAAERPTVEPVHDDGKARRRHGRVLAAGLTVTVIVASIVLVWLVEHRAQTDNSAKGPHPAGSSARDQSPTQAASGSEPGGSTEVRHEVNAGLDAGSVAGVVLRAGQQFRVIPAAGSKWNCGMGPVDARGQTMQGDPDVKGYQLAEHNLCVLIGSVGDSAERSGPWVEMWNGEKMTASRPGRLWLMANDYSSAGSDPGYGDNSGAVEVVVYVWPAL
jgi:hypothetical protein